MGRQISRWDDGAKDNHIDISAGEGPVSDLVPLPSGGITFSTYEPAAFGVLDAGGRKRLMKECAQG